MKLYVAGNFTNVQVNGYDESQNFPGWEYIYLARGIKLINR